MSGYWSKLWFLKGDGSLSAEISGEGVILQRLLASANYKVPGRCLRDPTFSRFDTIPACDRQTDRSTMMANTLASLAPRG